MPRKASDLLDVFRLKPADPGGDDPKKRRPKKSNKKSSGRKTTKRRSSSANDDVVSVSRRQLVYAGSVVVLLMALSFTLGVSMSGSDGDKTPALKRETAKPWYIIGYVSKTALLTEKKVDIIKTARHLYNQFGVDHSLLTIHDLGTRYRLSLGPFETENAAFKYHESYTLMAFSHGAETPFFPPEITQKAKP